MSNSKYIPEADVYINLSECNCVHNAKVFGLHDSFKRAKYPMSVEITDVNNELTPGIKALAQSGNGEGHDNFLNGAIVQFDLTFSNKCWVEAERYHFFDFVSSQSTMHRMARFDLDLSYTEYVDPEIIEIMKRKVFEYNHTYDENLKKIRYLELLHSNPAGFTLTAGMTTNYRQLKTMYKQRKNHRLPEWREFCGWVETLPYSELITGKES